MMGLLMIQEQTLLIDSYSAGNERELVGALHTKGIGTLQLEIVTGIINKYPLAGFLIGTSAAAPLLRLLYANGRCKSMASSLRWLVTRLALERVRE